MSEIGVIETLRHDFHFPGHGLPGFAFILMGFWWIRNIFKIYHSSKVEKSETNYYSSYCYSATYNGVSPSIFYSEGFCKLLYASFDLSCHILVVFYGATLSDEAQHITIYVFFIINAVVDIGIHLEKESSRPTMIPPGFDLFVSGLAWAGLGFLFLSHKHAKSDIQIYYHQVLGWIAIGVGICSLVQYCAKQNVIVALSRAICCILTGTWLFQIAFTFHNPWSQSVESASTQSHSMSASLSSNSHNATHDLSSSTITEHGEHETILSIMKAATILTWHVIGILIAIIILFLRYGKSNNEKRFMDKNDATKYSRLCNDFC